MGIKKFAMITAIAFLICSLVMTICGAPNWLIDRFILLSLFNAIVPSWLD